MVRPLLRSFVYTGAALLIVNSLSGGLHYAKGAETFVLASAAISIGNHFVRPFLNIILLPINLITLGLFRWVTSVLMLYVVTKLIPGFSISSFDFNGFAWQGIIFPEIHLTGILALLIVSFVISFISSFLFWLSH